MESEVASAMQGVDQKALDSQLYKDIMKSIAVSDVMFVVYHSTSMVLHAHVAHCVG